MGSSSPQSAGPALRLMRVIGRLAWPLGATIVLVAVSGAPGKAHKPILSPYTFHEDVRPILQARCARCHSAGGVAPMPLLAYDETVPWGESMRLELIAGHMPPWSVENASDFLDVGVLSARELNVLLTWASGGTPRGEPPVGAPAEARSPTGWPLGPPDLVLEPDTDFTLAADTPSETARFTLRTGTITPRLVRAVDLLPRTPSIVRRATLEIDAGDPPGDSGAPIPRVLALWQPGSAVTQLPPGAGFRLPADATLTLRIDYTRNWQDERAALTDRTRVGLYFAEGDAAGVRALALAPNPQERAGADGSLAFVRRLPEDLRALAIYPDPSLAGVRVSVVAVPGDGSRRTLIDFRPAPGWARRYVYREPVVLRAGTRLEVTARQASPALLPPGFPAPAASRLEDVRLTLDVVPE